MPVTIGVCLEEDGSRGIFGGVNEVWEVKVWF